MTTVALWHLGVSGILAGALGLVILVQSLADAARRVRRSTHHTPALPAPARPVVEPRVLPAPSRASQEPSHVLASAAAAR